MDSNKLLKYKRMGKRILSVFMIFCMALSILPQGTTAFAAEMGMLAVDTHVDGNWTAWSENDLPTQPGNYYLAKNITIDANTTNGKYKWEPSDGVTICLHGQTITSNAFINMVSGDVTIEDCGNQGGIKFAGNSSVYNSFQVGYSKAVHLTINGGTFSRNDNIRSTFGVYNGSTLTIKGGTFPHDEGYVVELNIFDTTLELSGSPNMSGGAGAILDITGYGAEQGQINVTGSLTRKYSLCVVDLKKQLESSNKYPFTNSPDTSFNDVEKFEVFDVDLSSVFVPTNIETSGRYVTRKNLESGQLEVIGPYYEVDFDYNGADGGNDIQSYYYIEGETYYKLPEPTKKGHEFKGWYYTEDPDDNDEVTNDREVKSGSHTLHAHWEADKYDIIYKDQKDENGKDEFSGTNRGELPDYHIYGIETTLIKAEKTGYTFDGWYMNSACEGEPITSISATYLPSEEMNSSSEKTKEIFLYAKWTVNTYNVTYEKNGGEIADEGSYGEYTYGKGLKLPTPEKPGYAFKGWYEDSGLNKGPVTEIGTEETEDKTFYAKWEIDPYTVTYRDKDEEIEVDDRYKTYTYENGLEHLPAPEKPGYTFGGWYEDSKFNGSPVTSIEAKTTGNKTFYAKWIARKYNITYIDEGNPIEVDTKYETYTYGESLTLPKQTKRGHKFLGWLETETCNEGDEPVITLLENYLPSDEEIVLYAQWTARTYKVIYKDGGSTIAVDDEYTRYTYGESLTLPTPTKAGYTFKGWCTDPECKDTPVTTLRDDYLPSDEETEEIVLYAKWAAETYTVTFRYQGATGDCDTVDMTVTYGDFYNELPNPKKADYEFAGWYTKPEGEEGAKKVDSNTRVAIADHHDLYAYWTVKTYTVTYDYNYPGAAKESQNLAYEGRYELPKDPKRPGYSFLGWFTSQDGGVQVQEGATLEEKNNQTFYAHWVDDIKPVIRLKYNNHDLSELTPFSGWIIIGGDAPVITVSVEEEGSGAEEITYTITEDGESLSEEPQRAPIKNGEAEITVNADFKGTIKIDCVDNENNHAISKTVDLIVENKKPVISLEEQGGTLREDGSYASAPAVEVIVSDVKESKISSGIASITYQIVNNGNKYAEEAVAEDFDKDIVTEYIFTIDSEEIPVGISTITVKVEDHAGNVREEKLIVKIWGNDEDFVAGAKERLQKIWDDLTVTNDTTKESLEEQLKDALAEEGFEDVTVTVEDFHKDMATTDKEGKIEATVTVSKGDSNETTDFDKNIDKLEPAPSTTPEQTPSTPPSTSPEQTPSTSPEPAPDTPSTETAIPPKEQEKNSIALMAGFKVSQTGKKISIKWGKVKGADGYQVYAAYCGKKFTKEPLKTVKSASTTKVSITKINGKKLNLKKNYKVYIAAYKEVNGKKVVMGKTTTGHIVGKNNKAYTNVKAVKVSMSKYTLKVGTTVKIKAKTVLVDKTKKQLSNAHAKEFRYKSTDTSVAVVSKKGKITAKGKGTCIIYVYARNGYAKKVKVTVK